MVIISYLKRLSLSIEAQSNDKTNLNSKNKILLFGECGKAQPHNSIVITPNGKRTIGELKIGDSVIGLEGRATRVSHIFEQGERDIYRVILNDGTSTLCADNHLWSVVQRQHIDKHKELRYDDIEEIETVHMMKNLSMRKNRFEARYILPHIGEVEYCKYKEDLFIDPYVLGVLLADGSLSTGYCRFSKSRSEQDIIDKIQNLVSKNGYKVSIGKNRDFHAITINCDDINNAYCNYIEKLGLSGKKSEDKFIPDIYKYNSIENRRRLIQGMFDCDGTIDSTKNSMEYSTTSKKLADDFADVCRSLGYYINITIKKNTFYKDSEGNKVICKDLYRVRIIPQYKGQRIDVFSSEKHKARHESSPERKVFYRRSISSIEYVGKMDCRCIMVEDSYHVYLTNDFIPTHNSTISLAYSMSQTRPVYVITPAGGSHCLSPYFPNSYVESLNNLEHLESIIEGLESEYTDVIRLRQVIINNEEERIGAAESYYRNFPYGKDDNGNEITIDIWDKMYDAAISQSLPFSAVVIEEVNIITGWLYDEVAKELNLDSVVGDDKSKRGLRYNHGSL